MLVSCELSLPSPRLKTKNLGKAFSHFVWLFVIADSASNSDSKKENSFQFLFSVQTLRTVNGSFPGGQWQVSSSNVERAHVKPCKLNCFVTSCYICFLFSCLFFVLCLFICFIKVSLYFLLCTGFTNYRFLSSGLWNWPEWEEIRLARYSNYVYALFNEWGRQKHVIYCNASFLHSAIFFPNHLATFPPPIPYALIQHGFTQSEHAQFSVCDIKGSILIGVLLVSADLFAIWSSLLSSKNVAIHNSGYVK